MRPTDKAQSECLPDLGPLKAKENPENNSWNLYMLAPYGYSSQLAV